MRRREHRDIVNGQLDRTAARMRADAVALSEANTVRAAARAERSARAARAWALCSLFASSTGAAFVVVFTVVSR